jgi:hypothetical protein
MWKDTTQVETISRQKRYALLILLPVIILLLFPTITYLTSDQSESMPQFIVVPAIPVLLLIGILYNLNKQKSGLLKKSQVEPLTFNGFDFKFPNGEVLHLSSIKSIFFSPYRMVFFSDNEEKNESLTKAFKSTCRTEDASFKYGLNELYKSEEKKNWIKVSVNNHKGLSKLLVAQGFHKYSSENSDLFTKDKNLHVEQVILHPSPARRPDGKLWATKYDEATALYITLLVWLFIFYHFNWILNFSPFTVISGFIVLVLISWMVLYHAFNDKYKTEITKIFLFTYITIITCIISLVAILFLTDYDSLGGIFIATISMYYTIGVFIHNFNADDNRQIYQFSDRNIGRPELFVGSFFVLIISLTGVHLFHLGWPLILPLSLVYILGVHRFIQLLFAPR